MQTPLCSICLSSDILCRACQERLRTGQISELEVKVSRLLYGLTEKIRHIKDISVKRVVETPSIILILLAPGDSHKLAGKQGAVARELAEPLKKQVRLVEDGDRKSVIQSLLLPAPVLGVNTVFTQKGEQLSVRVSKGARLPISGQALTDAGRALLKMEIRLVQE